MKIKNLLPLFLTAILFMGCQPKKETPTGITAQLDSLMNLTPDFSGVVLVAEKGKPIYHKSFGYTNFETKVPVDTASIFELASVSKQFTAMIIMMLKEEGKLNYDEPLEKYVPGLPYKNITIRHLLQHTSGLPEYEALMDEHWDKTRPAGNDDILAALKQYQPATLFAPGEKYSYCNTGYVMLGIIAEQASGKEFIGMCRDRIFTPLNMSSTDIRSLEEKAKISNFAIGHIYSPEKKKYMLADSFPSANYVFWLGKRKGPGRISSTSSDLLKWDRALYKESFVKKAMLDEAFAPAHLANDSLSSYGFGWMLASHPSLGKIIWHSGSNPGYRTAIVRYVDVDKTVIVLWNNALTEDLAVARLKGIENILASN